MRRDFETNAATVFMVPFAASSYLALMLLYVSAESDDVCVRKSPACGASYLDLADVRRAAKEPGMAKVRELMDKKLKEWPGMNINIAVVGRPGSGKSSLINAIRGTGLPDVAATGPVQTTRNLTAYSDPSNKDNVFWDSPGLGTALYSRKDFLDSIALYDLFVMTYDTRFTNPEKWLVGEIGRLGKRLLIVRTKIDIDLNNEKRVRKNFSVADTLSQIRTDFVKKIEDIKGDIEKLDYNFFMVSSYNVSAFDFPQFQKQLSDSSRTLSKQYAFLLLYAFAQEAISEKRKLLEANIWRKAMSAVAKVVPPIPNDFPVVIARELLPEVRKYVKEFGINSDSLEKVKLNFGAYKDSKIMNSINTKHDIYLSENIVEVFDSFSFANNVMKNIPIIRYIFISVDVLIAAKKTLEFILDEYAKDALNFLLFF